VKVLREYGVPYAEDVVARANVGGSTSDEGGASPAAKVQPLVSNTQRPAQRKPTAAPLPPSSTAAGDDSDDSDVVLVGEDVRAPTASAVPTRVRMNRRPALHATSSVEQPQPSAAVPMLAQGVLGGGPSLRHTLALLRAVAESKRVHKGSIPSPTAPTAMFRVSVPGAAWCVEVWCCT